MKIILKENQSEEIEGLSHEYPFVLHHVTFPETHVPWHWHEEFEFVYVIEGAITLATSFQNYTFHKNQAVFINSNVLCSMKSADNSKPATIDSCLFHSIFLGGLFKSIFETKYMDPVIQNRKLQLVEIRGTTNCQIQILSKLRKLSALQKNKDMEFQTRNLLSEIWLLLLEEIQELKISDIPENFIYQERIQTMMSYIHQNYQEKISLEDIAQSATISKRECLRCFQSCIHKSPFEYLLDYRIEMARRLLRTTKLPILDIALQTGFSSESYFCKIFKRLCEKTPNAYRKTYINQTI